VNEKLKMADSPGSIEDGKKVEANPGGMVIE